MIEFKNGVWVPSTPSIGDRVRIYNPAGTYAEHTFGQSSTKNKMVITSHNKRAIVSQGGELTVDIEAQDSEGNLLDLTDSFAIPVGKVGSGNYTTLLVEFVGGKATRSYIWSDAGEFEITSAMINMYLEESNKLDFDGFNITVAG